jgi:hypothetical protein
VVLGLRKDGESEPSERILTYSSRTPSRSPHRSQTDSAIATASASSKPPQPTIREETQQAVSRTLNARHHNPGPDTTPLSGHASRSGAPSASSNGAPRSKSKYRMVGDWQLQKTLGAGSMGKVKLGVNIHTREKVGSNAERLCFLEPINI